MRKILIAICLLMACVGLSPAHAANDSSQTSRAFLDSVEVNAHTRTITLSGWAESAHGTTENLKLLVFIGPEQVATGQVERYARPDVAAATGRRDWLDSGWIANVPIPASLQRGARSLRVKVQFEHDGEVDCVPSNPAFTSLVIHADTGRLMATKLIVIVGLGLLVLCFVFASRISQALSAWMRCAVAPVAPLAVGIVAGFATLVALGVSGTSLGITDEDIPIDGIQTTVLAGHSEQIRSDEWRVLTPMSIGQTRHVPPFPVVNRNLGPNGHNMLIPGMTSVPVLGVPALGRPATWGYFILPLPQALAWQWWMPAFGCLLALWACFSLLFRAQWRLAFCLSLCFVISPYVIAWSYWPAYVTMFAASAFSAFVVLLRGCTRWMKPLLAVLLGITASGFVLTLYPAWQVPLGYLFVMLLAAIVIRDRKSIIWSPRGLIWIVAGLMLAGVTVGFWWMEAKDAVAAMLATVYPGKRIAVPGGTIDSWYFARGFSNFTTLYANLKDASNQSEVASFLYLTLPAICGAIANWKYQQKNRPVFFALIAFLALATWYQFVGFPVELAQSSLWGRTFPPRVDIATGLAAIALIGTAFARDPNTDVVESSQRARQIAAIVVALLWAAFVWFSLKSAPSVIHELLTPTAMFGMLAAVAWCSYLLAARFFTGFFLSFLAFLLFSVASFNPWVALTVPSAASAHAAMNCDNGKDRTLVIGSNVPAMTMMASGCPVLNGVSYYPQMKLWDALDPHKQNVFSYNRYQHLFFKLADLQGAVDPVVTVPQGDVINVTVDARHFDFRRLPIEYVTVKSDEGLDLPLNQTLAPAPSLSQGWLRFKVVR
ncbi:hypothetical protein HHL24_30375 [Paraburkholderia sp. RP-4-7]|uniref:Glycosyltransferase RgtA/B/C/D-like domain-containing protein n=1 Tax=Paraburkholderia polaris TaxID=2728848 RepID=A0A848IIN3_9BURK|nr:hypothetical protein [Paraburkholderia polaris]NMM02218.1 hypothetical protein [Paraburkholderia polaris]